MKLSPGVMLAGLAGVLWLWEQNAIYQAQLNRVANASEPIGKLAGTVDRYMPVIVGAWDYYARKD